MGESRTTQHDALMTRCAKPTLSIGAVEAFS